MAIPNDGMHTFQGSDLAGSTLRITAGHDDTCPGIGALHPAEERTCGAISLLGNTACVHNNHVRRRAAGGSQAAPTQLRVDGFSIGAACATSEVLNVVSCHVVSLSSAEAVFRGELSERDPVLSALAALLS
jgi:hypothetical protein